MAKLEPLLHYSHIKIDADLVSNVWYKKARFYNYGYRQGTFYINLCRKLKGLPPKKKKYYSTREHRVYYPAFVKIEIAGSQDITINCKSNAEAKREYEKYSKWINERKTELGCKFKEPN